MGVLIIIAQLVLSLSILIVLHEFGHYLPAKWFKIRVEKFYLFFDAGFSLFKVKRGETEWGIGWLPLGGYVKISGMIDESMDKEQMAQPAQPWEFRSKPAWQRLIVMIGGVTVNFILGITIFIIVLFVWGEMKLPTANVNASYGFYADSLAQEIGFKTGDKILSVDNNEVKYFTGIRNEILFKESKTVQVERNGERTEFQVNQALTGELASYKGDFLVPRLPFSIDTVIAGSPAADAKLKKEDKIIGLNDKPIQFFDEFANGMLDNKGKEVKVTVLRGADTLNFQVKASDDGKIGVGPSSFTKYYALDTINYTFGQAIPEGYRQSIDLLTKQINAFGQMGRGKIDASKSLGGFASIGQMFGEEWVWERFWKMTAILSLILAFMNLLPIPVLDGGHVVFLLYELITGRAPSEKFMEYSTYVGFAIVIFLVLYANGLDIWRWWTGG
jgi:regulator of sigma E protease